MITAKDIKIRSRMNLAEKCTDFEASVMLQAARRITEREQVLSRGLATEQYVRQLKEQILYKLYGEIRDRIRNDMYDVKFKVMDQEEPYLSKMQAIDLIDKVFNSVTTLIDEKMKVD